MVGKLEQSDRNQPVRLDLNPVILNSWSSQGLGKLVGRNFRLAQDARKRADLDLAAHWHNTTFGSAAHDDVAAGLTNLGETEMLRGFDDCRPGGARQLRHALAG